MSVFKGWQLLSESAKLSQFMVLLAGWRMNQLIFRLQERYFTNIAVLKIGQESMLNFENFHFNVL